MTQDYSGCKFNYLEGEFCLAITTYDEDAESDRYSECASNTDCYYKQLKEAENKLKTSLEDNYTLGKHIEFIEKQLKDILDYGE